MECVRGQSTGATFGKIINLGETPSDIVLDESRARLYVVNSNRNRIDIYDYAAQRLLPSSIQVGNNPFSAALSIDNASLYVTNNSSSTLSVVDLRTNSVLKTVNLPARPEGVEVGADGRVLISTQGAVQNGNLNTLYIYDQNQQLGQQVLPVQFAPPAPTPQILPAVVARPLALFRGKLLRTPDGSFIIGISTVNNNASTVAFVYEALSGTVLRSRTVSGQASTVSMSPDGARFMAGFTLYDTATLNAIAQQRSENAPFPFSTLNTSQTAGGSAFSPDGGTIYSAFNVAPFSNPTPRPQSSTLLVSDPKHLGIKLGIKVPESIVSRLAITSDGANAWGISESGLVYLPLSTLFDYPILVPESSTVFLAQDECNKGIARVSLRINNVGKGKLTFAVPANIPFGSAALVAQASSGLAPATINFVLDPGRSGVNRQPGTNLYSGPANNNGSAVNINLASTDAINIPNSIRVFMNYRQADQRGVVYPVATVPNSSAEGLQDLQLDEARGKLYITNAGYNRIEVFDIKNQKFLAPMETGQLPHQMAMGLDGTTLYVGNSGGESISLIDLNAGQIVGQVEFPPIPRNSTINPVGPRAMAMGLSGLQFVMAAPFSGGTLWKLVGNQAVPRPASPVIGVGGQAQQVPVPFPQVMVSSPDNTSIFLLGGSGAGYLYDALSDSFTTSRQIFNQPITGFYGPLGIGPNGSYVLANGTVLNSALTQVLMNATTRNVAAVAPIDENIFVRETTAQRQAPGAATRDDGRTTLEVFDNRTGSQSLVGATAENPPFSVFGTGRFNVTPRQMVVDSQGNVYMITISGLSVVPLTPAGQARPQISGGASGIVNSTDGTPNFRPGDFIFVSGTNLASASTADQLPAPTVLGGSCVVFDDVPLPLLQTSDGRISAQIPGTVRPGINVVQVRSLATAQSSDPIMVTVGK